MVLIDSKKLVLSHQSRLHAQNIIKIHTISLKDLRGEVDSNNQLTIVAEDSIYVHGKGVLKAKELYIKTSKMMMTDCATIKALGGLLEVNERLIMDKSAHINEGLDFSTTTNDHTYLQINAGEIDNYVDLNASCLKIYCRGTLTNHQAGHLRAKLFLEVLAHHFFNAGKLSVDERKGVAVVNLNGIFTNGFIPDRAGDFGLPSNWEELAHRATSIQGHSIRIVAGLVFAACTSSQVTSVSICTLLNIQFLNLVLRKNSHVASLLDLSYNADVPNPMAYWAAIKEIIDKFSNGDFKGVAGNACTLENVMQFVQFAKWTASKCFPAVTKPLEIAMGIISLIMNAAHTYEELHALLQKEKRELRDWLPIILETMFGIANQLQMLGVNISDVLKNGVVDFKDIKFDPSYFEKLAHGAGGGR